MNELIYTTLAIPGKSELDILLLAKSIRTFGGQLANCPIWILIPEPLGALTERTQKKLTTLDVQACPFQIDAEIMQFPFAAKIIAAAFFEAQAQGTTERIAFMDRDTIVLQEPTEFLISPDKALGYRPVHHQLIGSSWNQPLNEFWELVYEACNVPNENIFPMTTHVGEQIRPYFNAGMFITRPENGLLAQWRDRFLSWYQQPQFQAFYDKDPIYKIFIHQAFFTGVISHSLSPTELRELSPRINYPLHLHEDIPLESRPSSIDTLVTVRYESIFDEPGWQKLPFSGTLRSWLEAQPRIQKG